MTKLQRLYAEQGQSPWLDNLTRGYLRDGDPGPHGRRGDPRRHRQPDDLRQGHRRLGRLRRTVLLADRRRRTRSRTPTGNSSSPTSPPPSPSCARSSTRPAAPTASCRSRSPPSWPATPTRTIAAARALHERIDRAQPVREDPGDRRGRPRDRGDDRRGPQHQHHPDLLPRPLRRGHRGLPGRPRVVHRAAAATRRRSTASPRSSSAGSTPRSTGGWRPSAPTRRWRCAAGPRSPRPSSPTSCSSEQFSGERWQRLADLGAHRQRPLWASTSTKNPAYPDTLYVDELIGPDTVNTLPEATIAAFEDHGTLARTIDTGVEEAAEVMRRLAAVGIDMDDVGLTLEDNGVASFHAVLPTDARQPGTPRRTSSAAAEMDWAGWALFGLIATTRPHRRHDRRPAGRAHPPRPSPRARHARHRGPRPGPGRRVLHPPRRRSGLRPRLRRHLRPAATAPPGGSAALLGLLHVAVALTVLLPLLPGVHPRMASHRAGPPAPPCWSRPVCSPSTTASRPPRSRSSPTSSTESFSACSSRRADMRVPAPAPA